MNIQIFGTKKCNDTKKAERFFKERGIKYQFIDMKEKGMSKGEFTSVAQVNGGLENMINWDGKDKDLLALIKYIAEEGFGQSAGHQDAGGPKRQTVNIGLPARCMEGLELRQT